MKKIQEAARIIKNGGVVVFPTETVYGLGANAFLPDAIQKIYSIKGRAQDNPLIIHISHIDELKNITQNIPDLAYTLSEIFWPGPLTLVLQKTDIIPDIVSAGGDTIGVRIPQNDIALKLIKLSGIPIVAPSANLSEKPSPTNVEHIFCDLEGKVDSIIDGGNTLKGVESTVIDLSCSPYILLRPGGVSFEALQKIIPNLQIHPSLLGKESSDILKSPGMKYRHYAPNARLILTNEGTQEILDGIKEYHSLGKKVGVLSNSENIDLYHDADITIDVGSRDNLGDIARKLFHTLREFDSHNVDIIFSEIFLKNDSDSQLWIDLKEQVRGRNIESIL